MSTTVHCTGLLDYDIAVSVPCVGEFMSWHVTADKMSSSSSRISRSYQLIQVFPEVLSHEPKRTQQRPGEVVEVGKSVVGIRTDGDTHVTGRTFAKQTPLLEAQHRQ